VIWVRPRLATHRSLPPAIDGSLRNQRQERAYVRLTASCSRSNECADLQVNTMQLETKFLHLRTPVTLGSRFGDWHVCWLGGWGRYELYYLVMVVRLQSPPARPRRVTAGR
jgi:hypothetical protein